ncbi:MFS transporter [Mammaliicoccus lentus]|jgi:OHS family lactose permease-like MFS transporter|uniref:MFS transporter n=1 Tax=Mammaliicoccus lentus TaxID=42858 RepID=UPI001C4F6D80|nr:MFS transporter [Mammaliicoccus lentus]MBW0767630.1 MFS transporter [Mammaliicoccus lentus]MDQ7142016.1 MFS transporter [Mammaliicoccus lentus]WHI56023.1 MFS transporter [Mammaliicoccus lentus]WHI58523.1 MFS transporter [Mammaliicoccus lentus]WHI66370.1 MFS transporter [Mammaliicoccus lentus]
MFQTFKNKSYLQSSFTLLIFFASWSIWWSFFQIWLTSEKNGLGLSGSEVGTIYSANSFVTLILMFAYGILQDKLVLKRSLLIFCATMSTLVGPFFIWIYAPLIQNHFTIGIIVGSLFLSAGFLSAAGIYEAVSERFSRYFDFKYGQARAWGSFGYAISALVAGFLFVKNPEYNFWIGSILGLFLLLNLIFWKPKQEDKAKDEIRDEDVDSSIPSFKEMLDLLKLPHLWVIVIFIMFSWSFYTIYDQQMFPDFYTQLFSSPETGQQMYGTLNSIQVFFEALMMGVVPIIMYKLGVRNTLLLGVCVMVARIGLSGVLTTPFTISIIKMMHAIEVPLFMLPMFRYITLHFNPKLSATLYMIGFQIAAQIGQVILSTPLGTLRDNIGYSNTFLVISGIALISGIFAIFAFKKDDEDVYGDPFTRQNQIKKKEV